MKIVFKMFYENGVACILFGRSQNLFDFAEEERENLFLDLRLNIEG